MPYIGNQPADRFGSLAYQDLTGVTGSPVKRGFTLNQAVANEMEIEVFVNNVRQEPTVAYTVSGTALTMTGDVETTDDFYVVFQGKAIGTVTHPSNTPIVATTGTFSGAVTGSSFTGDGSGLTNVSAGKVLQVIQTVKTDTFSTTSTSFDAITGLSAAITPAATSSKILVSAHIVVSGSNANSYGGIALYRGGSVVSGAVGASAGSKLAISTANTRVPTSATAKTLTFEFLDSPSSTSSLTYQPYMSRGAESTTLYVNQNGGEADNANHFRSISTITLIEIGA